MSNKVRMLRPNERKPISLEDCPELFCPECRGGVFIKVVRFRAVSPLLSASGKTEVAEGWGPVQCVSCGKVHDMDKLVIRMSKAEKADDAG